MKKAIIFDLDGTLIDTLKGIHIALNKTLKELNINFEYSEEEVRSFIGNGGRILFKKALKRDFKEEEYLHYLKNYEENQYISPLYEDVLSSLIEFKNKGYLLFIYSNKPEEVLKKLVKNKFPNLLFNEIKGENKEYLNKPDVKYILDLIKKYNLNLTDLIYVGDSIVDVLTAKAINLTPFILSYGYGDYSKIKSNEAILIKDFKSLKEKIDEL